MVWNKDNDPLWHWGKSGYVYEKQWLYILKVKIRLKLKQIQPILEW